MDRLSLWVPVSGFGLAVAVLAVEALMRGRDVVVGLALTCAVAGVLRHIRAYGGALAARTDPLTGLLNRRGHDEVLEAAVAAASPFSLLAVDLDGFKTVNDTHGHAVGDRVLEAVAARLRQSAGDGDAVARLGGDEFVLLVRGPASRGERLAGRVRDTLREPYDVAGQRPHLAGSVGVASYPDDGDTPAALSRRADRAMYVAKRDGHGWSRYTGERSAAPGALPVQRTTPSDAPGRVP